MATKEKLALKWENYQTNFNSSLKELRGAKDFFDVTLACEDQTQLSAHKVILSACSPLFRTILRRNPHQHPLIYLKGIKYKELVGVLDFMYNGEVHVVEEELNVFLMAAEDLKVKGLSKKLCDRRREMVHPDPVAECLSVQINEEDDIEEEEEEDEEEMSRPVAYPLTVVKEEIELDGFPEVDMVEVVRLTENADTNRKNKTGGGRSTPANSSNDGSVTCHLCNLVFHTNQELVDHSEIHIRLGDPEEDDRGEEWLPCQKCPEKFSSTETIKLHYQDSHGADVKNHICLICGKGFASGGKLAIHERMHTGEKPYECNYCGKRFSQIQHRNSHTKIHTGERAFVCPLCGKDFIEKTKLTRHMRTHSGDRPHVCTICGKSYTDAQSLKRHVVVHKRQGDEGM